MNSIPMSSLGEVLSIQRLLQDFPTCSFVRESPDSLIIRCTNKAEGRMLAFRLNDRGHAVEIRRGLKNDSIQYLKVHPA